MCRTKARVSRSEIAGMDGERKCWAVSGGSPVAAEGGELVDEERLDEGPAG